MINFLTMNNAWAWFGLAAILLMIELLIANTGFLLWIAIAAAITGVTQFIPGLSWYYQYLIFVIIILFYSLCWQAISTPYKS